MSTRCTEFFARYEGTREGLLGPRPDGGEIHVYHDCNKRDGNIWLEAWSRYGGVYMELHPEAWKLFLQEARKELQEENERLRAMLREVEWSNYYNDCHCPICGASPEDKEHTTDCKLKALIPEVKS